MLFELFRRFSRRWLEDDLRLRKITDFSRYSFKTLLRFIELFAQPFITQLS
jgi:hypothetical protein